MTLAELAQQFATLSLVAIGGVNAALPEIHRQFVEASQAIPDAEFRRLFAISQAAPGPNFLLVSLIGWAIHGITGALVTTVAFCAPSSVLAYGTALVWDRFRESPWRTALQRALAPISVGLVLASGYLLCVHAATDRAGLVISIAAAVIGSWYRPHPLVLLTAAAVVGAVFL